jgi:hypothetical protein
VEELLLSAIEYMIHGINDAGQAEIRISPITMAAIVSSPWMVGNVVTD